MLSCYYYIVFAYSRLQSHAPKYIIGVYDDESRACSRQHQWHEQTPSDTVFINRISRGDTRVEIFTTRVGEVLYGVFPRKMNEHHH